jgi:hypothetical protein
MKMDLSVIGICILSFGYFSHRCVGGNVNLKDKKHIRYLKNSRRRTRKVKKLIQLCKNWDIKQYSIDDIIKGKLYGNVEKWGCCGYGSMYKARMTFNDNIIQNIEIWIPGCSGDDGGVQLASDE